MATFNLLGGLTSLLFAEEFNLPAALQLGPVHRLSFSMVGKEAIVIKQIKPFHAGQVRCYGTFWTARAVSDHVTLEPGDRVNIVGQENITLLVEPISR